MLNLLFGVKYDIVVGKGVILCYMQAATCQQVTEMWQW